MQRSGEYDHHVRAIQLLLLLMIVVACSRPDHEQVKTEKKAVAGAAAQQSSVPLRIGPGIVAPVVVKRVDARLPKAELKKHRRGGRLLFEGVVTTDGQFKDVRIIQGENDPLAPAFLEAIRQWKFRPALKDGRPVDVFYNVSANIHVR